MKKTMSLAKKASHSSLPLVVVVLAACGGDTNPVAPTPTPAAPTAPTTGAVDAELTGTWEGQIEGSNNNSTASGGFTMNLGGDGTMSVSSTNPTFRPVSGTWGVEGDTFRASGPDSNGTVVTFTAPRSTSQLDGTFSTGSGGTGTFQVTKQ